MLSAPGHYRVVCPRARHKSSTNLATSTKKMFIFMILSSEDRKNVVGSIVSLKYYCLMIGRLSIMVGSLTGQLEDIELLYQSVLKEQ